MSKIDTSDVYERFIMRQTKDVGTIVWEVFDINAHKVYGYYTSYGEAEEKRDLLVRDRLYNIEIPPSPEFSWLPETLKACEEYEAAKLESNNRVVQVTACVWIVEFKGKTFGYFSSLEGANEYLEVLRNGSDEIIPRGVEEEEIRAVPKVHGVLQGAGSKGSDKPGERKDTEFLYDSGL